MRNIKYNIDKHSCRKQRGILSSKSRFVVEAVVCFVNLPDGFALLHPLSSCFTRSSVPIAYGTQHATTFVVPMLQQLEQ